MQMPNKKTQVSQKSVSNWSMFHQLKRKINHLAVSHIYSFISACTTLIFFGTADFGRPSRNSSWSERRLYSLYHFLQFIKNLSSSLHSGLDDQRRKLCRIILYYKKIYFSHSKVCR